MTSWFDDVVEDEETTICAVCPEGQTVSVFEGTLDTAIGCGWEEGEFGPVCPTCSVNAIQEAEAAAKEDPKAVDLLVRAATAVEKRNVLYCDYDGTLAHYDGFKGYDHTGEPIPAAVEKVKKHLASGGEVVIFTARVASSGPNREEKPPEVIAHATAVVQDWCEKVFGQRFPVTAVKGGWDRCYDDSIHQVIRNTGLTVQEVVVETLKKWERRAIEGGKPSEALRLAIEELELLFLDRNYAVSMTK